MLPRSGRLQPPDVVHDEDVDFADNSNFLYQESLALVKKMDRLRLIENTYVVNRNS
jgi:hypothetical protein